MNKNFNLRIFVTTMSVSEEKQMIELRQLLEHVSVCNYVLVWGKEKTFLTFKTWIEIKFELT